MVITLSFIGLAGQTLGHHPLLLWTRKGRSLVITLSFSGLAGQTSLVMGSVVGLVEGGSVLFLTASSWVGLVG